MAEKKPSIYVVMRRSGVVMQVENGMGSRTESRGPYLHILGVIAREHASAGGNYDEPDKLFLNGQLVVESGLTTLAWNFSQDDIAARNAAQREVQNLHMPKWLPDDEHKPGYNPPGIDKWIVTKAGKRP